MKRLMLLAGILTGTAALAGCEEGTLNYEGQEMKVSEVEERIADKLEVENPELDLEIDIYTESDD